MFKSYLASAIRNLSRNKLFSFINVGGLALGMAAATLILLFVRFELSYDNFWPNAERIYRAEVVFHNPGGDMPSLSSAPGPFGPAAAEAFPVEIEQAARVVRDTRRVIQRGITQFREPIRFVSSNFFSLLDIPAVQGHRPRVLANNTSVMISERMATKYFGDQDPINQTLVIDGIDYIVAAVMADMPQNTHFQADFIALFDETRWNERRFEQWGNPTTFVYLLLKDGVDPDLLEKQFPAFLDRTIGVTDTFTPSEFIHMSLVPLLDSHMQSVEEHGDSTLVTTFILIAVMILVIASINFMNLSTALSTKRAREVSLRKVLGAKRKQLVLQFLGESVLISLISLLLGLMIVEALLPWYNSFLGLALELDLLRDTTALVALIALAIGVGLLAGLYPAFILSSFRPASTLRSNMSSATGPTLMRKVLVAVQFAISITLFISTLVIAFQTSFARNIDTGFETNSRVVLRNLDGDNASQKATLKNELLRLPGVESATLSQFSLPLDGSWNTAFVPPNKTIEDRIMVQTLGVDTDFFQFFGVKPLAGRLFSPEITADQLVFPDPEETTTGEQSAGEQTTGEQTPATITFSIVLNESALAKFGFSSAEQSIGQIIGFPYSRTDIAQGTVIGVVPDLMVRSAEALPLASLFLSETSILRTMTLRIRADRQEETLAAIDAVWAKVVPGTPVSRSMVEDDISAFYTDEDKQLIMFIYFSILAISIAALGLYGLSAFAAERRTKEIGIRKILGARIVDIVILLVWQFSVPVLTANIIAWPLAYYLMNDWLLGYAFRIDLSVMYFLLAGSAAVALAWLTTSVHALSVARANPIEALRYE